MDGPPLNEQGNEPASFPPSPFRGFLSIVEWALKFLFIKKGAKNHGGITMRNFVRRMRVPGEDALRRLRAYCKAVLGRFLPCKRLLREQET